MTTTGKEYRIILVSDGTGETAALLTKAAMVQFRDYEVIYSRYTNIRSEKEIDIACEDATSEKVLIIFTMVSPELRNYLIKVARDRSVPCVDLLGPLLRSLGTYFGDEPKFVAGQLHNLNEQYFERIEAMEYTIAHDDGRDMNNLDEADLVILGVSRTSKTPLSMYLGTQGWKVANIPIIRTQELPKEVYEINQRKIVALTIDAEQLSMIRRARLDRLGQDKGGEYADPQQVSDEIEYANELFRKNRRWPVFNVTSKALEETASDILKLMATRQLTLRNLKRATQ